MGLTGGLGAGKSEALRALGELGAATLSTDAVVHELLASDELRDIVVARLGPEVAPDGAIDRSLVAERVFGDEEARGWLEGVLWPRVGAAGGGVEQEVDALDPPPRAAVVEVPLLFESGMEAGRSTRRSPWWRTRTCARERAGARGHAAVERARRPPALAGGKGAQSGLHGAQRRHARGVEGELSRVLAKLDHRPHELARRPRRSARAPVARPRSGAGGSRLSRWPCCSARRGGGGDRRRGSARTRRCARSRCRCATTTSSASRRADKNLDPALMAAVIYEESRFRDQTSHAGARGLMQITPETADVHREALGRHRASSRRTSPTPQINISYGAYYLRYLLDHYGGNETLAIAAYNAGMGTSTAGWPTPADQTSSDRGHTRSRRRARTWRT